MRRSRLEKSGEQLAPFDERQSREIAVLTDEEVKSKIEDALSLPSKLLKQVKVWVPFIIQSHDFAVEHGALRKIAERLHDMLDIVR